MNREAIINSFYDRFEHGFLHAKPDHIPLGSCDNCLEYAGKLLIGMTNKEKEDHKDLVVKVIKGLQDNILKGTKAFIPRTITYDPKDPCMDGEEERWEKVVAEDDTIYYARTDVSYSQYRNMFMGVDSIRALPIAIEMRKKLAAYIMENEYVIKRADGEPARNGNFNLYWNPQVQLSKYCLKEIMNIDHSFIESFWYNVMKWWPASHEKDNGENSIVLLYHIGQYKGYSGLLRKKIVDFSDKWLLNFRYTEPSDHINWLMFDKFNSEFNNR